MKTKESLPAENAKAREKKNYLLNFPHHSALTAGNKKLPSIIGNLS